MNKMTFILILSIFTMTLNAMADDIKEGRWQITTIISSKAVQESSPDNLTQSYSQGPTPKDKDVSTKCVTNANPIPDINKFTKRYQGCITPQIERDGNVVDYNIACNSDGGQVSLVGHVIFTGETMQGYASLNMVMKGQEESVQSKLTGKYMGSC